MKFLKKYAAPLLMLAVFETVSVVLWLLMDNIFYLFNFTYIGGCIALGLTLVLGLGSGKEKRENSTQGGTVAAP